MSLKAKIEAVIYASEDPVTLMQIAGLLGEEARSELNALHLRQGVLHIAGGESLIVDAQVTTADSPTEQAREESASALADERRTLREQEKTVREYLRNIVNELIREYSTSDRGVEIRELAGGYRFATKAEYHDAVRGFVKSLKPQLKLSLQALETLAVVAYKQPVTAPEISEIRGVDSGGVLGSLMARKLITTAGRKQVIGRPILYKTTKEFLLRFGLMDVSELPSISEFEKMAGALAGQEEISMPERTDPQERAEERIPHENLQEQAYATEPQADGDSDDLSVAEGDRPSAQSPAVDGRVSSLPPTYDVPEVDSSAEEASIQIGDGEAG